MTRPANLRLHIVLSSALAATGAGLMAMMIVTESEPGAIPLLMVALGLGWRVVTRLRMRARR